MRISRRGFIIMATLSLSVFAGAQNAELLKVKAKNKPDQPWKEYSTRTLAHLTDYKAGMREVKLSRYGGWMGKKAAGKGFFYAAKQGGRWWLFDPDGYAFIHNAVVSVEPGKSPAKKAAFAEKFGSNDKWAAQTTQLLRDHGFNGTGAWSSTPLFDNIPNRPVYTKILNFMSSYGKKRGGTYQLAGHMGYPNDTTFVFDPEFEAFCNEHAKQLVATKDDPYLLGHFSDNEMPFRFNALDRYLSLKEDDAGHKAAAGWMRARKGTQTIDTKTISDDDRIAFTEFMADRYFRITSAAIRKYDPNHLLLGSRLHGSDMMRRSLFAPAGKYCDVVSVNYYGAWTPDKERMANWEKWAGKPFMITEWYVKGADVPGLINSSGAGWIVPTQKDRGLFYQNFVLGLLESKNCVGWHWFKYMDNDPADLTTDPSNRDSNKGIVSIRFEPYAPLLDAMRELNREIYPLTEYFDKK